MFLDDENRGSHIPKWEKALGYIFMLLAYVLLAAGITIACLAQIPSAWRIGAAIAGVFCYTLCGSLGYFWAIDISFSSNIIQRKREWKEASKWTRFFYVITYPCTLILRIIAFFNT